jgi:hypothetical protein
MVRCAGANSATRTQAIGTSSSICTGQRRRVGDLSLDRERIPLPQGEDEGEGERKRVPREAGPIPMQWNDPRYLYETLPIREISAPLSGI